MPETLIVAFDGSATYSFCRADKHSFSWFGGPMRYAIRGKENQNLHHVASLNFNDLPILGPPSYLFDLPLIYALRFSGGSLAYKLDNSDILVLEEPGTLDEDWPYRGYPTLLPYIPVTVAKRKKQSWRQFAADFPNMKDEQPSDLVVIVPALMTIGVSLWGPSGDAEGVAMVFECDLKEKKVTTYNVCT